MGKFKCTHCGKCCHIWENKLSSKEEKEYLELMKLKFGIVYLTDLNKTTINIWPHEVKILMKEAEKKKIDLKIKPKRAVYTKNNELIILDYYLEHKICPFFNGKCTIYESRPLICRAFPLITTTQLGNCPENVKTNNLKESYPYEYEHAREQEILIHMQKEFINTLKHDNKLVLPSEQGFMKKLKDAKVKKLEMKKKK